MTDNASSNDLAFLRSVAEKGAGAPLLGGRFLIFWGSLVAFAYVLHYLILVGRTPFGPEALGFLWAGFGLLGGAGSFWLGRGIRAKPGTGSAGNRVEAAVWRAVGFGILFYVGGAVAAILLGRVGTVLMDTIAPVALVLYGVAFAATGAAAQIAWFRWVTILSFVCAGVALTLIGEPALYLFGTAAVLAVGIVPGLVLITREPPALSDEA
jgi:hypothetical protein